MLKSLKLDAPIGRAQYFVAGVLLFALKHNLDRALAAAHQRKFGLFDYWAPIQHAIAPGPLSADERSFLLQLILLSIPFVLVGVWLTLRRLRTIGLPGWLVAIFFVPLINLLLFATLSIIPTGTIGKSRDDRPAFLERFIPESMAGSAAVSLLFTVPVGLALVALGMSPFGRYGGGLFIAIPFCVGLGAALVFGYHRPRDLASCVAVGVAANLLLGGFIFVVAFEGIICLLMAMPLALLFGTLGAVVGYGIQKQPRHRGQAPAMLAIVLLFSPSVMTTERILSPRAPLIRVVSSIEINAPPERVWTHVVSFSELPPPTEALFRAGIAYPVRARIEGAGPGALRKCEFSTGPFIEPIQVWDEPHLLRFSVTSNPRPMQEWTPYRHVEPRHLDGYLVSRQGQFRLVALPGDRTLLEGTTWYQHHLWPAAYWQLWSDAIIHRIHLRVLRHIKTLAETPS